MHVCTLTIRYVLSGEAEQGGENFTSQPCRGVPGIGREKILDGGLEMSRHDTLDLRGVRLGHGRRKLKCIL